MATQQLEAYNTITLPAGGDLTGAQFKLVKISSGAVVLCGAGENAIGVLVNKPNTGEAASVQIGGIAKVQADAALATTGTKIMSSADGQAAAATSTNHVIGMTVTTAAAAAELVEVLLAPPPHGILA